MTKKRMYRQYDDEFKKEALALITTTLALIAVVIAYLKIPNSYLLTMTASQTI